ncbi:hypothetical protein Agub_g12710, partial [Astrephomene gubernaculifera]
DAPPVYDGTNEAEIVRYIDTYITCSATAVEAELVKLQTHDHRATCFKYDPHDCRFEFPRAPMDVTRILHPYTDEEKAADGFQVMADRWAKIKQLLADIDAEKVPPPATVEQLLALAGLSLEEYIAAVRVPLKRMTAFLRRTPMEMRINPYNPVLLRIWRANMDMQFCLDPYGAAMYIVSYMLKANRGLSRAMERAADQARHDDDNLKSRIRKVGNAFVNTQEMSAQEAVYLALGLPLRSASRQSVFVPSTRPEDRTQLLRPPKDLQVLAEADPESDDIFVPGLVHAYQRRLPSLEQVCIADFATCYSKASGTRAGTGD